MKNPTSLFLLSVMVLLSSCQQEIEVDIPDYEQKIVIEGSIEAGEPAMVLVSRSLPYFSDINLETLMNEVLITDAEVTVTSSTGETESLAFSLTPESPVYMAYTGHDVTGEPGKSYTLSVKWGGREYTAQTSVCRPVSPDSTWLHFMDAADTMPTVRILLTDNPATHDYYMFRIRVHGKKLHDRLWVTSVPVAFDDATFNGQTVNYEILRANPSALFMMQMSREELAEYYRMTCRKGDTVYLRTSMIDHAAYQYWQAMTYSLSVGQNPFVTPPSVPCNISGENVIGNWCGFASTIDTLYYPE